MKKDESHSLFLKVKDHSVSGKIFELKHDQKYDLLKTFPKPKTKELPAFYKSENYISHTDSSEKFFDKIYQKVKSFMIGKKLKWIKKEKKAKGALLDIGAGTGEFVIHAKKWGWISEGVEPNSRARSLAAEKKVFLKENSSSFSTEEFDVITMWHVLEHVPDLDVQIKELYRLLKKEGLLIIAVPNYKSYDAQKYQQYWAAYDAPRHLWHFSRKAIKNIFMEYNFKVSETKALQFDSYYVSLLSEKYKNGKCNYFKGIYNGLISNIKARSTGEYSSVVYFLKKQE